METKLIPLNKESGRAITFDTTKTNEIYIEHYEIKLITEYMNLIIYLLWIEMHALFIILWRLLKKVFFHHPECFATWKGEKVLRAIFETF